eukprot:g11882.t1
MLAESQDTLVPCDCLIINGSAIVNEATLTGESVPQMKDAMGHGTDPDLVVDCFGTHRIHALFSGTSLIQTTAPERVRKSKSDHSDPTCPPDEGILCFVLRTGFNSSQGELMRMIEFSTESVGADVVETALQLAFLLVFALVAAGYVMKSLSCELIITSVVPPSLPMQMAFAVNTALMSLLKGGIYCTEPFRVPYAGRVSHCFFDKTGTLTSDQMVAVGIINAGGSSGSSAPKVAQVKDANPMACVVIAGCHSLIEITIARQKTYMAGLKDDIESDKKEKEEVTKKLQELEKSLKQDRTEASKLTVQIKHRRLLGIVLRALGRMSTICKVASSTEKCQSGVYSLVKGSPEAIAKLLVQKPSWYESSYKSMAEQGQRVLALGYARLVDATDLANKPREEVEKSLTFAGFIAFKCETRKDSMLVIRSLQDSSHTCVMLTGDAPLTALSVAVEVGIATFDPQKALVLAECGESWRPAITSANSKAEPVKFEASGIQKLSESCDLIITGAPLERAWQMEDSAVMQAQLSSVKIFARLSPFQKEQIIQAVRRSEKSYSFMCGDGGNDVGALKEADVGLALLSGFGNANVDAKGEEGDKKEATDGKAEDALEAVRKENQQKAQEIMQKSKQEMQQKKHGNAFAAGAAKWAEGLDSMEDTPMVQLGDASTAAPFTTRTPSISSVVDIIRQGRLSERGPRQMMASGVFVGIASLAFSFARPLDRMHPVRPLSSVFHPANLFSMLGQLAIHLFCMVYIANLAKEVMGEEAVRDIIEFEKERNKRIEAMTEEEMSEWNWFSSVPFKSNLLNTCCWLVETAQQVSVIFVNYKGRPWMKGLLENQPLFLSLFVCIGMVAVCARATSEISHLDRNHVNAPSDEKPAGLAAAPSFIDQQEIGVINQSQASSRFPQEWSCMRRFCARIATNVYFDITIGVLVLANIGLIVHQSNLTGWQVEVPEEIGVLNQVFLWASWLALRAWFGTLRRERMLDVSQMWTDELSSGELGQSTGEAQQSRSRCAYFLSKWNILDFVVLSIDWVLVLVALALAGTNFNSDIFRVLRVIRALRVLRSIRTLPLFRELYIMLYGFISSAKAIAWAAVLLLLILMIMGIIAVEFIHPLSQEVYAEGLFPEECLRCDRAFESVWASCLTFLQQIVAGDSWGQATIPIIEKYPYTAPYFILAAWTRDQLRQAQFEGAKKNLLSLCEALDEDACGFISLDELLSGYDRLPEFQEQMRLMDVEREDMQSLFRVLDEDGSGDIAYQEFVEQVVKMRRSNTTLSLLFLRSQMKDLKHCLLDVMENLGGLRKDYTTASMSLAGFGDAAAAPEDGGRSEGPPGSRRKREQKSIGTQTDGAMLVREEAPVEDTDGTHSWTAQVQSLKTAILQLERMAPPERPEPSLQDPSQRSPSQRLPMDLAARARPADEPSPFGFSQRCCGRVRSPHHGGAAGRSEGDDLEGLHPLAPDSGNDSGWWTAPSIWKSPLVGRSLHDVQELEEDLRSTQALSAARSARLAALRVPRPPDAASRSCTHPFDSTGAGLIGRPCTPLTTAPCLDLVSGQELAGGPDGRGQRLHFACLGDGVPGPAEGWVSLSLRGRPLLQPVALPSRATLQAACEDNGIQALARATDIELFVLLREMGVEVSCLPLEDALDSTRTDSAPQETEERGAWLAEVQEFDAYVTDPYRLFGIPYDATDKTIKSTYRKLSLKLHPDRCPGAKWGTGQDFERLALPPILAERCLTRQDFLLDPYQRRAFNEVHGFLTPTVNVAWWSDWDEVFAELEAEIGTRPPRALHAEKADVLLLGATGLTGTLACMVMSRQAAVGRRSWAIAGRDGRKLLLLQQKFANEAFRGAYRVETTEDDRETGTAVGGEDAGGEEVEPAAPVPAPAARRSIFNSSNRMRSLHRASVSAAVAMNDETFAKALQAEAEEFGEESAAKITSFEAIANFVIGCIGAGIVVFPKVMALNGYGLALLLILLSAVETGRLMLAACEMAEACTGARPGSMSNYEDLAGAAFGSTGKTVLAITKNSYALGALFVYTVLLVEGVCSLLEFMKPNEDVVRWAVVTPCVLALSMITNLKQLARVAPLGTFAVFAQCAAICVGSVMAHWMDLGVHETKRSEGWRFASGGVFEVGSALSVFVFGS